VLSTTQPPLQAVKLRDFSSWSQNEISPCYGIATITLAFLHPIHCRPQSLVDTFGSLVPHVWEHIRYIAAALAAPLSRNSARAKAAPALRFCNADEENHVLQSEKSSFSRATG